MKLQKTQKKNLKYINGIKGIEVFPQCFQILSLSSHSFCNQASRIIDIITVLKIIIISISLESLVPNFIKAEIRQHNLNKNNMSFYTQTCSAWKMSFFFFLLQDLNRPN